MDNRFPHLVRPDENGFRDEPPTADGLGTLAVCVVIGAVVWLLAALGFAWLVGWV